MLSPEELQALADVVVRALPLGKSYTRQPIDLVGASAVLGEDQDRIVRVVQQYDISHDGFSVMVSARFRDE